MENSNSFWDITIHYLAPVGAVVLLGLLGGKLARMGRLPKVTGYLLTGLVIGPSGMRLISIDLVQSLSIVNDIALGLIMFAIGGVFEFHHIKSVGKKTLWLTLGQSVGAVLFTTVALYFAGIGFYPSILLGTLGIATAPAATILVIREFEARGDFTDSLITVVATSNIVCILAFQLVFSLGELGGDVSAWQAILSPLYELGGSLVIGGTVGYLISKWEPRVDDQAELLMIILAGVMLTTGLAFTLNLQPLFATLIMGAVTTNLSLMHRLVYIELRQVEQPLYIAFFVLAGASLHLDLLPGLGLAGFAYLIARVAGKIIGVYLVSKWKNLSHTCRNYLGLGMMVQAGVAIGLIDLVNRSDPDTGAIVTPIVLATVLIYETVGPPVIRFILYKAKEIPE
ncbi:MAG: cation:proton antiporter [bacterium]|nr:cation:proton antiporter [bacterium]